MTGDLFPTPKLFSEERRVLMVGGMGSDEAVRANWAGPSKAVTCSTLILSGFEGKASRSYLNGGFSGLLMCSEEDICMLL